MGHLKVFRLLVVLTCSLSIMACSATPTKRSMGEVIDDAVISNKLKVKYINDKKVSGFKINVDTWKGVVKLNGELKSQAQIDRAIELAERQLGVKEVKSYLSLKPSKNEKGKSEEFVLEENDVSENRVVKNKTHSKEIKSKEDEWIPTQRVDEETLYESPKVTND